jgi:hypothetical protein
LNQDPSRLKPLGITKIQRRTPLERALSILKSWRLLLIVSGVGLLLAGFYAHNQAMQAAGFMVAIFGAFGGG